MSKEGNNGIRVGVIGAGPVGLAAAAHLVSRGITPVIFERGDRVGHSIRSWGHVRVFSPWSFNVDSASRSLLEQSGWKAPNEESLPLGNELVEQYLEPLARLPEISENLNLQAKVISITRKGYDKSKTEERATAPFLIRWVDQQEGEQRTEVRAVIDASGTWLSPNPMGVDGNKIDGEQRAAEKIHYGIPDVLNKDRHQYADKRVLVVGGGHSAINAVLDLLRLQETATHTKVTWALRRNRPEKLFGGGLDDKLPARGALGLAAKSAIEKKRLELLVPFAPQRIERASDGSLLVEGTLGGRSLSFEVDIIVVATGFRPDIEMLREIRTSLDPVLEAPPALAPLIDPNHHSCGSVPPHGVEELKHPSEPGFYIVGSKSYGRAPTFLMATGYEQVRSVVAEIAGDDAAAREVRLVLPETGVCSASQSLEPQAACCDSGAPEKLLHIQMPKPEQSYCCGGPSPVEDGACCLKDHEAKTSGGDGCGCNSKPVENTVPQQQANACCTA